MAQMNLSTEKKHMDLENRLVVANGIILLFLWLSSIPLCIYTTSSSSFFFFFFGLFLGLHPEHMELPRLGVKSEL